MAQFFRILAIDGGGIRGIIPAQILVTVEAKLKQATGDPGVRIADCFDLIAGTSTGGILACIYLCPRPDEPTRPRFSAEEAVELYFERGDEIFHIPLWHRLQSGGGVLDEKYPATGLETALNDYLGDLKLSQLIKPCLIPAYDIKRRAAYFFRQHDARKTPSRDFPLGQVARATSAAPTFFECANVKSETQVTYPMVDGGVFANNPSLCAYAEARSMEGWQPTARQMVILSLGTGAVATPYYYPEAKDWGAVEWMRPVLDIMMSGVAETVDYQLQRMFDAVGAVGQYLRLQAQLTPEHSAMDNAELSNLRALKEIGQETAEINNAKLDAFVQLLLASESMAKNVRGRRSRKS
jgi:patatin-like phospholipase/acyl hydrolase